MKLKRAIFSVLFSLALLVSATADEDFGLLIFNHQIAVGMTYANVISAWGRPERVDRAFDAVGVTEYWFMPNGWMVIFENGRVASFYQFAQPR